MWLTALTLAVLAAPMPGDAEARRFKEAFEQGEAFFQQGEYGAAVAAFREADRFRVTPEVAYDLAKCHEKLGDVPFAVFYYRLYIRRAPNAPDTLEVAEQVGEALAKAELDGLGLLELDAPRASAVTVAGRRYPQPPVAVFLPPGDYEVKADFPSGPRTMRVQLKTGQTTPITFEPVAPPLLAVELGLAPGALAQGEVNAARPLPATRVVGYVLAGLGLATLATGAALGAASRADAATAMDRGLTIGEAQRLAGEANGKATAANVLFSVGGAATAGAALFFVFSLPEPGQRSAPGVAP